MLNERVQTGCMCVHELRDHYGRLTVKCNTSRSKGGTLTSSEMGHFYRLGQSHWQFFCNKNRKTGLLKDKKRTSAVPSCLLLSPKKCIVPFL